MANCTATTARGRRCRRKARLGERLCGPHLRKTNAAYTDDVATQLVAMLRAGNQVVAATRAAGISIATYGVWMRRGAQGQEPYAELRRRVERARAEAEVRHVTQIATAGGEDWRASAWMLERRLNDPELEHLDTSELAERAAAGARFEAEATLISIGEDVKLNTGAIDRYASATAVWATLEARWEHAGRPGTALGGATGMAQVPHPLLAQIAVARREAAQLGASLGLDPLGRMKLSRHISAGRPPGAASAPDRAATGPPRRRLRAVE